MICSFDYFSDWFLCCRPDGSDLYLISSPLLHIFDQTISMLPFATRTDMIDALKKFDVKMSDVDRLRREKRNPLLLVPRAAGHLLAALHGQPRSESLQRSWRIMLSKYSVQEGSFSAFSASFLALIAAFSSSLTTLRFFFGDSRHQTLPPLHLA